MSDSQRLPCFISLLPTEILTVILCFLSPQDIMKCGQVCSRWRDVVAYLTCDQKLWKKFCERDYGDIYIAVQYRPKLRLPWFCLYRSLSMWPRLTSAVEYMQEFAMAMNVNQENRSFRVLCDGSIGVHKRGLIQYYSIDTLKTIQRDDIIGDYSVYNENAYFITVLDYFKHLYVVRKSRKKPTAEGNVTYDNVIKYILVNKDVYYVTEKDEIYTSNADIEDLKSRYVCLVEDKVISLGYTDRLHVMTEQHDIFSVFDNRLVHVCTIGHDPSPLHQLQKHNIFEPFCWQNYFQCSQTVRLRDVLTVYKYGDVFFLGTCWGVLHIYHAPFSSNRLDLLNVDPMRQYNFYERDNNVSSYRCPILQIDVVETPLGHTVIVMIPKKVILLNFTHDFFFMGTSSSVENTEAPN